MVLSVRFGLFLNARPGAGAVALIWASGVLAILAAIILLALSLTLKCVKPGSDWAR
jgi:uncharacterized membrane protein HdeD (DUF308 family)